ncbi:hypothetical protein CRUP_003827 [Coryphaenoides rupestris]|nr:hypothetical protein CRUP_003827 [Coryphaenoides rupestris]
MPKCPTLPPIPDPQMLGFTGPPRSPAEEMKMAARQKLLRYRRSKMNNLFLRQCVESRPGVPIQQQWLDNILSRTAPGLRQGPGRERLVQELLLDFSAPWHDSFVRNRKLMKENLHILHPAVQPILDIGYVTASGPVDCNSLRNRVVLECDRTEQHIMKTWFYTVIHLLTSKKLQRGLKSLLERSVEEFVNLFDPSNAHKLPLFHMDLTFDYEKIDLYPSVQDLEDAVLGILKAITNTMQKVQTVKSWLSGASTSFVDAKLTDQVLTWAHTTVKNALVEEFLALSREIANLPEMAHFAMIHLKCLDLKQGLANKAKAFAQIIVARLVRDHRFCQEFETIRETALRLPENTEEMTEMIAYIAHVKSKGIAVLQEKIMV